MPIPVLVAVAWPYASGSRHLGHLAGAYLPADIFARHQRIIGNDVLMVSGSDVHGTPITVRADAEEVTPQELKKEGSTTTSGSILYDILRKLKANAKVELSLQSTNYLTYSLYRIDVILRETIVVGTVGGVGLGWQLKESLSAFAWEEVLLITTAFIAITLISEALSEKLQRSLLNNYNKDAVLYKNSSQHVPL